MTYQPHDPGTISIVRARKDDLVPILHLFNEAVAWLNERGLEKQWGTRPFSALPQIYEQFMGWINREIMFVARLNDRIIGSFALNTAAPSYLAQRRKSFPSSAFYLEAFVTSRTP